MRYPTNNHRVTSKFGYRKRGKSLDFHSGEDYGAIVPGVGNDPIHSIADNSKVVFAGYDQWRGHNVILEHSSHCTRYNHLDSYTVKVGDIVHESTIIGFMGNTGDSEGVHLHFEVHECKYKDFHERWSNREPKHAINPELFFLKYMPKVDKKFDSLYKDIQSVMNVYK